RTVGLAAVAVRGVAVVALLAGVDDPVAARRQRTVGLAAVAVRGVAVVALLAGVDDPVAAHRQRTVGLAAVAVHGVAVVALLAGVDDPVAARRHGLTDQRHVVDAPGPLTGLGLEAEDAKLDRLGEIAEWREQRDGLGAGQRVVGHREQREIAGEAIEA